MKKIIGHIFYIAAASLIWTALSSDLRAQSTWHVDIVALPGGDGTPAHPFNRIQHGINAASDGDTVLVEDGTYTGYGNRDLWYNGKEIIVKSASGAAYCVIDCEGTQADPHRGFYFYNRENRKAVLDGFTIRNGYTQRGGGAIYCVSYASPTIVNNIITGNTADRGGGISLYYDCKAMIANNLITENTTITYDGGGIQIYDCSPIIKDNVISANVSDWDGGGIYCERAAPTITGNTIIENTANGDGGGICSESYGYNPTITHNIIFGNHGFDGGGLALKGGSPLVINNLITQNFGHRGGGINTTSEDSLTVLNCTIFGNTGNYNGGAVYGSPNITNCICRNNVPDEIYGTPAITYSNIQGGYAGAGNIDADPRFVTGPGGDYYLLQPVYGDSRVNPFFENAGPVIKPKDPHAHLRSPCVDAGSPSSEMIHGTTRIDAMQDSGIIDMGYHYLPCISGNRVLEEIP